MAAKPVDIYVRVSRVGKRDRDKLRSPEEQEQDARRFACGRGLAIGEVIRDIDKSGGSLDRPGLRAVLERVRTGASAGVVVAYLSRASRDTRSGLDLLDEITRA